MLKIWSTKIANRSKIVSKLLSLIDPFDILAKHGELTLALHPMKIPNGYQITGLEELGLWSTSQSSLWIWSLCLNIRVVFPLSILWGYIPFTNTLCNKYCLLILPLFVAICEIWLPGLTYSVYLVLSLKLGATGHQLLIINIDGQLRCPICLDLANR